MDASSGRGHHTAEAPADYRRVLWVVLGINAAMFLV